jgi:hypothetical protein
MIGGFMRKHLIVMAATIASLGATLTPASAHTSTVAMHIPSFTHAHLDPESKTASPDFEDEQVAAAGTAPSCIKREVYSEPTANSDAVQVGNKCGKTMRVKIIIKYGPDSSCRTLKKGKWYYYQPWVGRYKKTVTC